MAGLSKDSAASIPQIRNGCLDSAQNSFDPCRFGSLRSYQSQRSLMKLVGHGLLAIHLLVLLLEPPGVMAGEATAPDLLAAVLPEAPEIAMVIPAAPIPAAPIPAAAPESKPAREPEMLSLGSAARLRHVTPRAPWVGTQVWSVPESFRGDVFEGAHFRLTPWAMIERDLDKYKILGAVPAYSQPDTSPLFPVLSPDEPIFIRKLRKLLRAKGLREIRGRAKREWKSQFLDHPGLSYATYENRLFLINTIGRDPVDSDDFNVEYDATVVKQDFFGRRRRDGESDLPLFAWGPFTVSDTGSLKFDLGTAAHATAQDEDLDLGEEAHKPFVASKEYRIDTKFNIDVDPFRSSSSGDLRDAVRRYGVTVEVNWLSEVLGREMVATELEVEADLYGDFKAFFNIVVKSR